ncbi:MAG: shikimate kinase [Acidimicrobiales bacterium]
MATSSHLVLLGAMGVGKTTVGRVVAAGLRRPLRDSDLELRAAGRNARDVALVSGVDALHLLEADHLLGALAAPEPAVIAAAASVVDDARCLAALEAPFAVWLWAPFETLAERMRHGDHRRDLGDDPLVAMTALAQRRDPRYRQVADATIDVGRLAADQVAEAVLSRFEAVDGGPRSPA